MNKHLNENEYIQYAPDAPGTVRRNHITSYCQGKSQSLAITRKEDGSIRAYCHRCGRYGSYSIPNHRVKKAIASKRSVTGSRSSTGTSLVIPNGCEDGTCRTRWPVSVKVFLSEAEITDRELTDAGIVYNPYHNSLIFPIYREGELVAYQERNFDPEYPKYITKRCAGITPYYHRKKGSRGGSSATTIIIVEDILSAIRVARFTDSIALMGNALNVDKLTAIKDYDKFIVWLDNDNSQIEKARSKITRRLQNFGEVITVRNLLDPKKCTDKEIEDILNGKSTKI